MGNSHQISEPDWKHFRSIEKRALERFCQRILDQVVDIASDTATGSHARYLDIYKVIQERDKEIGDSFNNPRRSTALLQLARMRGLGLVTDEEYAGFSQQARQFVGVYLGTPED